MTLVRYEIRKRVSGIMNAVILILSAALIVFISVDTFQNIPFLENHAYMTFQFWVCVAFMGDFLTGMWLADSRWRYFRRRFLFFLLSVPYLNIIDYCQVSLTAAELYWVRFIPMVRGTLAIAMVVGYVSSSRIAGLLGGYITILVASVYFGSLIFLNQEYGVNQQVAGYGDALWWACMDATTMGCDIQPVTAIGKITGVVLSCMGVLIFPLFTVYVTTLVQRYNARSQSYL